MAIFKYSAGDSSLLCRSKEPNHPKMMCNNTNKTSLKKELLEICQSNHTKNK